ncbi:MAG: hypothetical protein L0287_21065 [Anaerolineae bacterium]|nr:hypothetical protein [Anaerolineae bacterium]
MAITAMVSLSTLLFSSNFVWGPDVAFHIYNAQQYLNELQSGVFYPRWLGDWFGGYGAPIGVIYAPLLYLSSSVIALIGLNVISSIKLILWISVFLSGIFMYELARKNMGIPASLLASILYQIAPYRLIDTVGRTALSESLAFTWLPVILLSILNISSHKQRMPFSLKLSLYVSLLILTHFLIAYLFLLVLMFLCGYLVLTKRNLFSKRFALHLILSLGLAMLLTAFYWLPAIAESRYLNTTWFVEDSGWGNYENNFLFGAQVYINTGWESLYKENTIISIVSMIYLFIGLFWFSIPLIWRRQRESDNRALGYWMFSILIAGIIMSSGISKPVWELIPRSEIIAFPWRWLTVSTLGAAFLAGDIFNESLSTYTSSRQLKSRVLYILYGASFAVISIYTVASLYILIRHRTMLSDEILSQLLGETTLQAEYYPWVYANEYLPVLAKDFDYSSHPATESRFRSSHPSEIQVIIWKSVIREFLVSSSEKNTISIRTFWFPGWTAFINNQEVGIRIRPDDGTILIDIPEGISTVRLEFTDTHIRRWAIIITFLGVVLAGCLVAVSIRDISRLSRYIPGEG